MNLKRGSRTCIEPVIAHYTGVLEGLPRSLGFRQFLGFQLATLKMNVSGGIADQDADAGPLRLSSTDRTQGELKLH